MLISYTDVMLKYARQNKLKESEKLREWSYTHMLRLQNK
jgi:hypothetical protein